MAPLADPDKAGEGILTVNSKTVRWRIDVAPLKQCSRTFKVGDWNWCLELKKKGFDMNCYYAPGTVKMYPSSEDSSYSISLYINQSFNHSVEARFFFRIAFGDHGWHPGSCLVQKKLFKRSDFHFQCELCNVPNSSWLIEVEFLELEIILRSIDDKVERLAEELLSVATSQSPLKRLSRMFALNQSIRISLSIL